MERIRTGSIAGAFRAFVRASSVELFVAGVLAILVALAAVRSYLPAPALPLAGLAAFAAFTVCGAILLRVRKNLRGLDSPAWGVAGALAITWIAAGRLAGADHVAEWLR